jgi:tape measure domain-containing protein
MHIPSTQLGAGYYAVGKGLKGIQSAYGQVSKFLDTKKFPVTGAISEIGGEFGNAIKQVLLFGTAYKALAFLTSLPGQAFEAAKGLATYKNQLEAVTKESGTFEQSFAFVDNLATRFNVPLNSARQGFAKLYASMKPAGFDQGQIEGLFTGISKAAAAFGLSSDKVDRVNYAFAQMASKGQIMSEELKGQLGDVLPGALGLFAKAAQMSIPEFSKAMEDGAFKGKAMEQVLGNVAILLDTQFGSAAEGASKTLQGAVNQIQNNLQLMYESFGPIVNAAAAAFGPQINSLIKDVTDTMKVLTGTFTQAGEGFETLSPRAQAFYSAIQTLRPSLEQAGVALADLGGKLASLLPLFVQVISAAIGFASSPLGRGAIIAATAIGVLTGALKLLEVTGLKAALKAVYAFIGGLLKIPAATGAARLGVISLKLALTGVFVGAIFLGLDLLIGKLLNIGDAANNSKDDIRGMRKELDAMAGAGDIESTSKAYLDANTKLAAARKANQKALSDLKAAKAQPEGDTQADISKGVAVANAQTKVNETYAKVIEAQKDLQAAQRSRASAVAVQEQQDQSTKQALQKIDLSGEEGVNKKKTSLESYHSLKDQLAKDSAEFAAAQTEEEFRHQVALLELYYDIKEARANEYQKDALRFEREMMMIESRRREAYLKANLEVQKAQFSVAGGAGGGGSATGSYLQGDIGPTSTGPHFDVKKVGGGYFPRNYLDQFVQVNGRPLSTGTTVPGGTFAAHQKRGSHGWDYAFGEGRHAATLTGGAKWMEGTPTQHGERRRFQLPSGEMFQFLHGGGEGIGAGAPGKVTPDQKRDAVATQNALQASIAKTALQRNADEKAAQEQIATFEKYRIAAFPTVEQDLQNKLLAKRNDLFRQGLTDDEINKEIQLYENQERGAAGLAALNRLLAAGAVTQKIYNEQKAILNADTAVQNNLLREQASLLRQQKFDQATRDIQDQLAMARAFTPDQELRTSIAQKGLSPEQSETLFQETKVLQGAQKLKEQMQGIASSIGDAFGNAFKGIIDGSMTAREALAGMFQSIADHFADMVAQMIAEWIKMMVLKGIQAIINPMAGLGNLGGGGDVLGSNSSAVFGINSADMNQYAPLGFANGGIAPGGFTAFANGGMVTGPTMGLVGEGRYNEAIVPLPNGKSIPVELGGASQGNVNVVVNVDAKGSQVEGNEAQSKQLGRVVSAAVQAEIVKQQRPGGLLSSSRSF